MEEVHKSTIKSPKVIPATTKKVYFLQAGVVHGKAAESAELLLLASRSQLGVQAPSTTSLGSIDGYSAQHRGSVEANTRYSTSKIKIERQKVPKKIHFDSTQSLRFSDAADLPDGVRGSVPLAAESARRSHQTSPLGILSNKDILKVMPQQQQSGSRNILRGVGTTEGDSTLRIMSSRAADSAMGESQRDSIPQPNQLASAFTLTQQSSTERFITDSKTRNHDMLSKDYESEFA